MLLSHPLNSLAIGATTGKADARYRVADSATANIPELMVSRVGMRSVMSRR
jgi:hypothetical protein